MTVDAPSSAVKRPFWTWLFCESDGTPSFARFGTFVLLAFVMGWDTAYTVFAWRWNVLHLPVGQAPVPLLLDPLVYGGQAAFFTALYGTNKFTTYLQNRSTGGNP